MIDLRLLQRLTTNQACAQLVEMVQELRARQASVREQKSDIRAFLRYYGCCRKLPWISWSNRPMLAKAAILLALAMLAGCRAPQFSKEATVPSRRINWYADVDWPSSPSPGVKTYFVSYGLHPNTMTNELVTAANHCRINGLELGRTYYFAVRASDGVTYSERTPIVAFKTP